MNEPLKVVIVSDEFFAWGRYGGFGMFSRKLGKELVRQGVEVEAWVKKSSSLQKPVGQIEDIDGVLVKTLPPYRKERYDKKWLYKSDADVIHSQGWAEVDTWFAFKMNNKTQTVVTFQDPRSKAEMRLTVKYDDPGTYRNRVGWKTKLWKMLVERRYKKAVRHATVVASQALYKIPYLKREYGIDKIRWLPNMVDVPDQVPKKAERPMVVFIGRLDPIKRPELFCEIAPLMPDVDFHILGASHVGLDTLLRTRHRSPNLHFEGFDDGAIKTSLLSKAWMLVNTSVYECLPISFLEAGGYGCAIASCNNPDDFARNFGVHVSSDHPEAFKNAIRSQLENDSWKRAGVLAHEYVKKNHETKRVVQEHLKLYKEITTG